MNDIAVAAGTPATPGGTRLRLGAMRIAIGLVQACALLWIYRMWLSHWPFVAGPLMLVLLFALPVAPSSLGHMKPAATATWAALCAAAQSLATSPAASGSVKACAPAHSKRSRR